jgi:hypothetical protein
VEKALKGRNPRRAPARSAVHPSGASSGEARGRSRERTPEGSKASRRATRPSAGEPEGSLTFAQTARGEARVMVGRTDGRGKPVFPCLESRTVVPSRGLRARPGRGARRKAVGHAGGLRAGVTVDVEPAGKQKAAERRHGSSGRESSEGRIPTTSNPFQSDKAAVRS